MKVYSRRHYKLGFNGQFSLTLGELTTGFWHERENVYYCLRHNGKTIFEGTDFQVNVSTCKPLSVKSARSILGFLSCKPGDTDDEYFKDYTPEQISFVNQYGEEIALWSLDEQPEPFIK